MAKFTDLDVSGKRVLVRVDFNVPMDEQRRVTDDTRIRAALPTIQDLLDRGASVILMSHIGRPLKEGLRPDGSVDRERFSVRAAAAQLGELLGVVVSTAEDVVGDDAREQAAALRPGEVLMLENTRFERGEEKGDAVLAKAMADLGDVYVNDAFGSAHRAHASTATVAQFFAPEQRAFGLLMGKELDNGRKLLHDPARPVVAITGGAKVSDKVLLLEKLLDFADDVIVGGGMAYTFIKAGGGSIGQSLVEADLLEKARGIRAKAEETGTGFYLPADSRCARKFAADAPAEVFPSDEIPDAYMGLDIGEQAQAAFAEVIQRAKTILWNGPMGVFEFDRFARGTMAVAGAVAAATAGGAYSLIGGGDSAAAIAQAGLEDRVSFVSTGGGAMLEFLEGKTLPGVAAIEG